VAMVADGERGRIDHPGNSGPSACLADLVSLLCIRVGAGVRWARVPGTDSDARRSRGHAECDCFEFHPIQPCSNGWSGAGWDHLGEVRREVVFWPECAFVSGAHYLAFNYLGAILAG